MPSEERDQTAAPFIAGELRPDLSGYFDGYPEVGPDADADAIRRAAGGVLGPKSMQALGLAEALFSRGMWSRRLVRDPDVIWTETDDGQAVLLHLVRGTYFSLSPLAAAAWAALDGDGISADALLEGMRERYGLPDARIVPELETFLAALVQKALIKTGAVAPTGHAAGSTATAPWPAEFGEMEVLEHGELAEITNQSKAKEKDKEKEKEKEKDADKKDIF
jgi:hypothetical protein